MHLLISMIILFLLVFVAAWIGVYVVLPLFLFWLLVSGIVAVLNMLRLKKEKSQFQKASMDNVIDVDFEEIN